jgi:hypothetical protein
MADTPKAATPNEAETPKEATTRFKEAETPKEAETTKAETPEEAVRPPKDGESWSAGSKMWQSPMPVMDFQEEMRSIPITLPVLADPGTKNAAL